MRRPRKALPEKLYASTVHWEGWTFHILSSARGVRFIDLRGRSLTELADRLKVRVLRDDEPNRRVLHQVHDYLQGTLQAFTLALDVKGTSFQQSVWDTIGRIPYGKTVTYGQLAAKIRRPDAARAVGQAVGANPVPIVVPCHRIVGSGGALVGFGGGLPLKERLLALEKGSLSL